MIRNKALNRSIYRREKQKILTFVSKNGENALQRIEQFSIELLKSSWVVSVLFYFSLWKVQKNHATFSTNQMQN